MKIPLTQFTAPAYRSKSINNVTRMVNLFPEKTEDGYRLVSFPGFEFSNPTGAPGLPRAALRVSRNLGSNGFYAVYGDTVVPLTGGTTRTIGTSSGFVSMAYNHDQLLIVDGSGPGWIYDFFAETITNIGASPGAPVTPSGVWAPTSCCFLDGYFIANDGIGGQFYLSNLLNGLTWTPTEFATAESAPDILIGVGTNGKELYLFGRLSTEIWYNTGDSSFPFQRISGGGLGFGISSPAHFEFSDDTLYVLGDGSNGGTRVYEVRGTTSRIISTPQIDAKLVIPPTSVSDARLSFFEISGHRFLYLRSTTLNFALCYDVDEGNWFEIDYLSAFGGTQPLFIKNDANTPDAWAFMESGSARYYRIRDTYNKSDAQAMNRIRTFGPIESDGVLLFHRRIRFELEAKHDSSSSYTLTGTLQWSDDGGKSFNSGVSMTKAITSGTTGQKVTLEASRLGSSRERYYRLTLSDAAKFVLKSATLDVDKGRF